MWFRLFVGVFVACLLAASAVYILWSLCEDTIFPRDLYSGARVPFGDELSLGWPPNASSFRVLQISDTQVTFMDEACRDLPAGFRGRCGVANTTLFIERLMRSVRPDFVVVSGDVVSAPRDPRAAFGATLSPIEASGVPYGVVLGNHDVDSCGAWDLETTSRHVRGRASVAGTSRVRVGGDRLHLWLVDYNFTSDTYLDASHLAWIADPSRATPSTPLASLAFLHVPLRGTERAVSRVGRTYEKVYPPPRESGLALALGRLPGMVAVGFGHDHTNDYCGDLPPDSGGLRVCYAGAAGYTTYGHPSMARRARVYDLFWDGGVRTHKVLDNPGGGRLQTVDTQWLRPRRR